MSYTHKKLSARREFAVKTSSCDRVQKHVKIARTLLGRLDGGDLKKQDCRYRPLAARLTGRFGKSRLAGALARIGSAELAISAAQSTRLIAYFSDHFKGGEGLNTHDFPPYLVRKHDAAALLTPRYLGKKSREDYNDKSPRHLYNWARREPS